MKLGLRVDRLQAYVGHSCALVGKLKTQDGQLMSLSLRDGILPLPLEPRMRLSRLQQILHAEKSVAALRKQFLPPLTL